MEKNKALKLLYVDMLMTAYDELKQKSDSCGGISRDYIHEYIGEFVNGELDYYVRLVKGLRDKIEFGRGLPDEEKRQCSSLELRLFDEFKSCPNSIKSMFKKMSIEIKEIYKTNILCGEFFFVQNSNNKFYLDTRNTIEIGEVVNDLMLGKPDRFYKNRLNELSDMHLKHIEFDTQIDEESKVYLIKYLVGKKVEIINRRNELSQETLSGKRVQEMNELVEMSEIITSWLKELTDEEQNFN